MNLEDPLHPQAQAIFKTLLAGKLPGVIPHPVLAETYYVAARVYEKSNVEQPEQAAEKLVDWLYKSPNFTIAESSLKLALGAGQVKRRFGLPLTDSYVIAASKLYGGKAAFRTREREIQDEFRSISRNYE